MCTMSEEFFVVVKKPADLSVKFTRRVKHPNKEDAIAEAARLANLTSEEFVVMSPLETVRPTLLEFSEPVLTEIPTTDTEKEFLKGP